MLDDVLGGGRRHLAAREEARSEGGRGAAGRSLMSTIYESVEAHEGDSGCLWVVD